MSAPLQRRDARVPRIALRKQEAARALGLSDESFDRYVKPHIPVVRWGSLRVYPTRDLFKFVDAQAEPPLGDTHGDAQPVAPTNALQNDHAVKGR
jgi:hypothetical protein